MRITKKYPSSLTLRHHWLETLFQFIKSFKNLIILTSRLAGEY